MIILKNNNKAFTLIEILVSLTILSIIMVSVMFIFINSTRLSAKTEINRVMQENIKNVIETITEDIRINWIKCVSEKRWWKCDFKFLWNYNYKNWIKLETKASRYFLAYDDPISWMVMADVDECNAFEKSCYIVKNWTKLTNSSVSVKDLKFKITNDNVPKVTISIVLQPSARKWVKSNLIKENKIILQTTISERIF